MPGKNPVPRTVAARRSGLPVLLFLVLGLGSAGLRAQAPVTQVVLYPGSATVTRTAPVTAGATLLRVSGVTTAFPVQALRVDADPGIRVGQIDTLDAGQPDSPNPAQAELEGRIQALQDQVAAVQADIDAARIVKGYLERLGGDGGASADHVSRAPADAHQLAGLIEAIGHGATDALARAQRLGVQKRELEKKVAALQRDLERQRGDSRDTRTITISLSAARAGTVRISYPLVSAGWRPAYRAELSSTASSVELRRLAQVSQKTGEDWQDVELALSTSEPTQSPVAPVPQPWLLSYSPLAQARVTPAARLQSGSPLMDANAVVGRVDGPAAPAAEPAYEPPSFQTDNTFNTVFAVPGRVSLASGARERTLELAAQTLAVHQRVQVSPRLNTVAMVIADADRPAGAWLPGNLQIYRDGSYVGTTAWNPVASEHFVLPFGRDELVRVTLDHIAGRQGSTGVFEKRKERHIADRMTVTSAHTSAIDLRVLEAAPVSVSEEIKVTATLDPEPATRSFEERRGVAAWEQTLKPGESARFGVDYTIEYPRDGTVPGINR